jgi:hypothetical protein
MGKFCVVWVLANNSCCSGHVALRPAIRVTQFPYRYMLHPFLRGQDVCKFFMVHRIRNYYILFQFCVPKIENLKWSSGAHYAGCQTNLVMYNEVTGWLQLRTGGGIWELKARLMLHRTTQLCRGHIRAEAVLKWRNTSAERNFLEDPGSLLWNIVFSILYVVLTHNFCFCKFFLLTNH